MSDLIAITAERPPVRDRVGDKAVAVNIGWRILGDAIRVAMAVDDDGIVSELRLPLDAARSHERRHQLPSGWRDLAALDQQVSDLLERVKSELLGLPESCRDSLSVVERMQQGGLVRCSTD